MRRLLGPIGVASGLFVIVGSCTADNSLAPRAGTLSANAVRLSADVAMPTVVISQVYGGGGNSGATYKNDFIELFNPGPVAVNVSSWSVQYGSATGTTWQVTMLSGTIQPRSYYLVQEAAGAGGTTALPTPDKSGTIAMSATSAKVVLRSSSSPLSGACPNNADIVDRVVYDPATNCAPDGGNAPKLSNTTAARRGGGGCVYTGRLSEDFVAGAPTPRNAASPTRLCQHGILDHVTITGVSSVSAGSTIQLTGRAEDGFDNVVPSATIAWSSSDETVATVDATGLVTGIAPSAAPVSITATTVDNDITRSKSVQITVTNAEIHWIDVFSSSTSFPPGFQTQLFATARTAQGGTVVPATFTFEAENPEIATVATVNNTGIVTGVAAPTDGTTRPGFRVTATPVAGGTPPYNFTTHSIFIETPVTAPTSIYGNNDEFGDPTPASASNLNDLLVRRPQFVLSYNASRGTPNWVSYELDSRQMVSGADRCNCFTADPVLPAANQILTSDYTSGGYDRGHMARSADRTKANVDNATTFYLTNIVPQTADLNQGVWAQFENALGDTAKAGRAVYIITGPLFSGSHDLTFLKKEGKVAIPDATWKVALIGPQNNGTPFARSDVTTWDDLTGLTILVVNMPNVTGIHDDPWAKYLTTVDKIEELTGYDFLSLLQSAFQDAIEAGDHPPTAQFSVSGNLEEGAALTFDASASYDPDLGRADLGRTETLSYAWRFSDGSTFSGRVITKTFANNGTYTATLIVSDAFGWEKTSTQSLVVVNVPPRIAEFASAELFPFETYSAEGSFTDPGEDVWNGTVNYGDGSGDLRLALSDKHFQLEHVYESAGKFPVTVGISDGDATSTQTQTVVVLTPVQGMRRIIDMMNALVRSGELNRGRGNSFNVKLDAAIRAEERGQHRTAENELEAYLNELKAAAKSSLSAGSVESMRRAIQRVINAISHEK